MLDLLAIQRAVPVLARAGGGGSGGGGGGGSGFALIGYLPMHLLGAHIRKLQKKHVGLFDILQIGGWVVVIGYAVALTVVLRSIGFIAGIGALLGMGAGLYGWFGKLKQSKATRIALSSAALQDGAWDEQRLQDYSAQVFVHYQNDWSNANTEAMKQYLTPQYQYHAALMTYAMQLAGRRNAVQSPVITQSMIVAVTNVADNNQDEVSFGITAQAHDQLIDTRVNQVLFTDTSAFNEFWRFRRTGNNWLLDGIQQATASSWKHNASLEQFAAQNGYFYSLDWGWLLMPSRGQLFSAAKFGTSGINNHVIGVYNQQLLVQLYTYVPKKSSASKSYLIAQANLSRSYGDIVVRKKHATRLFGIKGLREVSTEWPDFNKKYQVYATSPEQATSLELLNPSYMQQLEAVPFEVNIEVVDNVVYLYAPEKAVVPADQYQTMLGLLQAAFREMRM